MRSMIMDIGKLATWGFSSFGRALVLQTRGDGFKSRNLHVTDAAEIKIRLADLIQRTENIVAILRQQKALLQDVSIEFGNLGGQTMQYVEGVLEVAERKLDEPISNTLIALRHADEFMKRL